MKRPELNIYPGLIVKDGPPERPWTLYNASGNKVLGRHPHAEGAVNQTANIGEHIREVEALLKERHNA